MNPLHMFRSLCCGLVATFLICMCRSNIVMAQTSNQEQVFNNRALVSDGHYGWFTRIENIFGDFLCVGAFIGSRFVATTKQCTDKFHLLADVQAVVGFYCMADNNCNKGPKQVITVHRRHDHPKGGDMTILELKQKPSINIVPAIPFIKKLNKKQKKLKKNRQVTMVSAAASTSMTTTETRIITRKKCRNEIKSEVLKKRVLKEKGTLVCSLPAGGEDSMLCGEDPGSVLVAEGKRLWKNRDVVMAIHVVGPEVCETESPMIHFRMHAASKHLKKTLCTGDKAAQPEWCHRESILAPPPTSAPFVPLPPVTPVESTIKPTTAPTTFPSDQPNVMTTSEPSNFPTMHPTNTPTEAPSGSPTVDPSQQPNKGTSAPSQKPTSFPSRTPTLIISTEQPTLHPSTGPSFAPSKHLTESPSVGPTQMPTSSPSTTPTDFPSAQPTTMPTSAPSGTPTTMPTQLLQGQALQVSFPNGFPCNITSPDIHFMSLPEDLAFPQFIPTEPEDTSSPCFLRLTDDVRGVVSTSAQRNFVFSGDNVDKLFSVKFGYRIHGDLGRPGDGMTFVMHQDPRGSLALGGEGGRLGIYDNGAIVNALVIELDTYPNRIYNDNGRNNIHVVSTGPDGAATELAEVRRDDLRNGDGSTGHVWVEYCGNATLRVYLNSTGDDKPEEPVLTAFFDLKDIFEGNNTVAVGFTGATWSAYDYHDVMSWTMREECIAPSKQLITSWAPTTAPSAVSEAPTTRMPTPPLPPPPPPQMPLRFPD